MTTSPVMLPVESLVAAWVRSNVTGLRCVTELPANLAEVLPVARFTRIGGTDSWGLDNATLDVDYFAIGREASRDGSLAVLRKLRYDMPGALVGSGVVMKVETVVSSSSTPWDDSTLRRFTFTVNVIMHSR